MGGALGISSHDVVVIGFLIFLEGILSIDNALVLALIARHLPPRMQRRALTYGLFGAFFFRAVALFFVTELIRLRWVKFAGGGYLLFLALKHFLSKEPEKEAKGAKTGHGFWRTVAVIELTDLAFAVDSILAAVALTQKFWVVYTGGVIGIVMMRFSSSLFIRLLERYPRFESTAYALVAIIGVKLVVEGFHLPTIDFHSATNPAFWVFWLAMALAVLGGFRRSSR